MTRAELISLLEKDAKHPELLYQKDYINRFGLTADTKEPYAAVAAGWLTGHRDLWMGVAHGLYRLVEGNRVSIMMKDPDLQRIRKQRVFPPFGEVLPVALVLLGNRSQELGRPSMLLYDGNPSGVGDVLSRESTRKGRSVRQPASERTSRVHASRAGRSEEADGRSSAAGGNNAGGTSHRRKGDAVRPLFAGSPLRRAAHEGHGHRTHHDGGRI